MYARPNGGSGFNKANAPALVPSACVSVRMRGDVKNHADDTTTAPWRANTAHSER